MNAICQSSRQIGRGRHITRRLRRRAAVGVAMSLGVALLFGTGQLARAHTASVRGMTAADPPVGLRAAVDKLVVDGQPGVIVMTRRGNRVSHVTAGVGDVTTGQPMSPADRVQIGSITKTFVSTVILQLVAEHRLSLDDSVQRWLPGVVTGGGYKPEQITVRDLLHQTSGLRDYTNTPDS